MSDLLIKRAEPIATALIQAVSQRDQTAVLELLAEQDPTALHALAIVLADRCSPVDTNAAIVDAAITNAARAFGTTTTAVASGSKYREDVDSRAVACYVARLFGVSHSEIGRHIGRDHSTVMHAVSRVGETSHLRGVAMRLARQLGWEREAS